MPDCIHSNMEVETIKLGEAKHCEVLALLLVPAIGITHPITPIGIAIIAIMTALIAISEEEPTWKPLRPII